MTVYAPNASTYTSRVPYITAAEYMASPTGVNVSQLVPRGTPEQNDDALRIVIERASSYADTFCRQVLAATLDTQSGRYRIQRTGFLQIPAERSPIIAVNSIKVGFTPSSLTDIGTYENVWIDRKVVSFPIQTVKMQPLVNSLYTDGRAYAVMTYVNGYANTLTTASATAGATSLTVDSTLGVVPGMELSIYDPAVTETVTVVSVTDTTITIAAPLQFNHATGVSVSCLPPAVKQAVVLLASALIKTRGSEAIVMNSMRATPSQTNTSESGGYEEIVLAKELLQPYVRAV